MRRKADPVQVDAINSDEIRKVLQRMRAVMKRYGAVGIAAPQIGIPLRIIMIEFSPSALEKLPKEIIKKQDISPVPFSVSS